MYSSVAVTQLWVAGRSTALRLPGTHGQLFPWDPPSLGIPDKVLAEMASQLRKDVIKLARTSTTIDRTTQSSPTSQLGDAEPRVVARGVALSSR